MKLEDQVCSLELAKKLKSLNVKQESLFSWFYNINNDSWNILPSMHSIGISAFTVAELGEMLPAYTNINGNSVMLELSKYYRPGDAAYAYSAEYWFLDNQHYKLGKGYYDKNEANVRAEMKIFLIENKLIEVQI